MNTSVNNHTHPSDGDLVRYMDGEGAAARRERARDHLDNCPSCQQRLSLLRARSAALSALIEDVDVPEREVPAPPALAPMGAAARRGGSSSRQSAGLLKAAVILLLLAAPAIAMVQPVRDWIASQWSEISTGPDLPYGSATSVARPGRSAVSFIPADMALELWLEREPGPEMIRIVPAETDRVTIETVGGRAGDRLVVLPRGVRIESGSDSGARYVVTVPSTLERVVVYIAGAEHRVIDPQEGVAELRGGRNANRE